MENISLFDRALAMPDTQLDALSLFRRLDFLTADPEIYFSIFRLIMEHTEDICFSYQSLDYRLVYSTYEYQYSLRRILESCNLEKQKIVAHAVSTRCLTFLKKISEQNSEQELMLEFLSELQLWDETCKFDDPNQTLEMFFSIGALLHKETISPEFKALVMVTLKQSTDQRLRGFSTLYERQVLEDAGLDPYKTLDAWSHAYPDLDTLYRLQKKGIFLKPNRGEELNLTRIFELREVDPECPHMLQACFHISNFGRYPLDVLLRQYWTRWDCATPYCIALFPVADWNGVFYGLDDVLTNFASDLAELGVLFRIVEVGSLREAAHWLKRLYRRCGGDRNRPKIGVIVGHGTPYSIQFGVGTLPTDSSENHLSSRHLLTIDDLRRKGLETFLHIFEADSPLVFVSCSTGKERGIACHIARLGDFVTYAPDGEGNISNLSITRDTSGDGFNLRVGYSHNAATRVFSRDTS